MKIKGMKVSGPNSEILVIPRGNGDGDIVFRAQAILDYEPFEKLCPEPVPPKIIKPGGKETIDVRDIDYVQSVNQHGDLRWAWIVLTSLRATEDLEWETVDYEDPNTWLGWTKELKEAGFTRIEIGRIEACVLAANCLSSQKIEEARERFILAQALQAPKE